MPNDLTGFVVMDEQNWRDIHVMLPATAHHKIHRFADFCRMKQISEVPDPYYGGTQDFERVLDILEDGCQGLLHAITASVPK